MSKNQFGEMLGKDVLIMTRFVSAVNLSDDTHLYDLETSLRGAPIIKSVKTGKRFLVTWEELIKLAHERGIDKE